MMKDGFKGFLRPNDLIGTRNKIAILSTVLCTGPVAPNIAKEIEGSVLIQVDYCSGGPKKLKRLEGICKNPNIGAILIIGLGCEGVNEDDIAEAIATEGKPFEVINIRKCRGVLNSTKKGIKLANKLQNKIQELKRNFYPLSELKVGIECGGSDGTSGIAANPAAGAAADLLIDHGSTVMFGEICEMLGCGNKLIERASDSRTRTEIQKAIKDSEKYFTEKVGSTIFEEKKKIKDPRRISPGNIKGGLTTLEEKSLGAIKKGGTKEIQGILEPGEYPERNGLYILNDAKGSYGTDVGHFTELITSGAQIILFTTGVGSPVGSGISPVIKITGNPESFYYMKEHIDINASKILLGNNSVDEIGANIFSEIISVASGDITAAEKMGCDEFQLFRLSSSI